MDKQIKKLILRLLIGNNILIAISLIFILYFVLNKNFIYVANHNRIKEKLTSST